MSEIEKNNRGVSQNSTGKAISQVPCISGLSLLSNDQ